MARPTKFKVLREFNDGDGYWFRRLRSGAYHVVRVMDLPEWSSDDFGYRYAVDLQEIDLCSDNVDSALRSYGGEEWLADFEFPLRPEILVECLSTYGCHAPLGDWNGNNLHRQLRAAMAESRRLEADEQAHENAMSRPVNAIGSTAREYGRGDFDSAIARGVARQDPAAHLMAKLQTAAVVTLKHSDMLKCPHAIMVPSHYRPDGSCKCNDPAEQAKMIREWGYRADQFS